MAVWSSKNNMPPAALDLLKHNNVFPVDVGYIAVNMLNVNMQSNHTQCN